MKSLSDIQRQLAVGEFEFSRHAFRRVVERNISEHEIREAGVKAEVIEDLMLRIGYRFCAVIPAKAGIHCSRSLRV